MVVPKAGAFGTFCTMVLSRNGAAERIKGCSMVLLLLNNRQLGRKSSFDSLKMHNPAIDSKAKEGVDRPAGEV